MKTLLTVILFTLSASSFADCVVKLKAGYYNTQTFREYSCRDALRECNRYKRNYNVNGRCETVTRNDGYGNGGYNGGNNGGYNNGGYNGGYVTANTPGLINAFIRGEYRNCSVRANVSGWAHQVYVNGIFRGNYDVDYSSDRRRLKEVLANLVNNGSCRRY